jgi:hypothetical protein
MVHPLWSEAHRVKLRGWILVLLFLQVMVHPLVHLRDAQNPAAASSTITVTAASPLAAHPSSDQCELCRVSHSTVVSARLPQIALLNPRWIAVALQAVNYDSLQAGPRIASRAPPLL